MPPTGDGISVSTLSVDTSSSGSSTSTESPSRLSHLVTVPSVTLSPSAGIWILVPPPLPPAGALSAAGACCGSGAGCASCWGCC
jgi:hypothetical protein